MFLGLRGGRGNWEGKGERERKGKKKGKRKGKGKERGCFLLFLLFSGFKLEEGGFIIVNIGERVLVISNSIDFFF